MTIKYNSLDCDFLCGRFPELKEKIIAENDWLNENLPQVTLLEYLWDEYITYTRAMELMGEKTRIINQSIDYLSIPEPHNK